MADRFYGVEFGGNRQDVVEGGSSTASLDVEVRVTFDATNNSKKAVLDAIEQIKSRVYEDNWPPA